MLCLSLFAHLLSHFSPAAFLSQLSQQTDVLLFEIELYSTVGVSNSEARLALMGFFSCCLLLPTVFHPHPTLDDVMPPFFTPTLTLTVKYTNARDLTI